MYHLVQRHKVYIRTISESGLYTQQFASGFGQFKGQR